MPVLDVWSGYKVRCKRLDYARLREQLGCCYETTCFWGKSRNLTGDNMPKHEFGIMQRDPTNKDRFDAYEPQKYNCIIVDDDAIEPILVDLTNMECYWHTLQRPGKGLAYYGITLIPPKSMDTFIRVLYSQSEVKYISLIFLANRAKENNRYIIHFGI